MGQAAAELGGVGSLGEVKPRPTSVAGSLAEEVETRADFGHPWGSCLMPVRLRFLAWLLACLLLPCGRAWGAVEVTVFAPASLLEALTEVAREIDARGDVRVRAVFGSTSTLARQIRAGARGDVFISADEQTMTELERAGEIRRGSRRVVLTNQLAVVVPRESAAVLREPKDLAGPAIRRLALAETETVPAGRYARAWLEQEGVWPAVSARIVAADSVRAALARVAAGHADAGVVYRSDVAISPDVRPAWVVPAERGPAIRYPAAVLRAAPEPQWAAALIEELLSVGAQRRFAERGFGPPREDAP